jgi:acetophenone carboxylase
VRLGPESMGAAPGPACYGLGGNRATLTDAMVILGLISPTAFLDGRRVLDAALAGQAIDRDVAAPLGISTEEAARRVVAAATAAVADLAKATAAGMGWQPADTTLYAFGGNGPLLATGVAERLGITTVALFGMGSVLSAFGSAISDVVHVYESAVAAGADPAALAGQLRERAERDLKAEGLDPASARYVFEVTDAQDGTAHSDDSPDRALAALGGQPALVRLTASVGLPSIALADRKTNGARPAPNGDRPIPAYQWAELPGAEVAGPALVDGGSFTWLVDPGWSMSVDSRGDAMLTQDAAAEKEGSR